MLTEERLEEEAEAEDEEELAEGEDRGLLFHAGTDRKPSIAGQNQPAPRRVRFTRFGKLQVTSSFLGESGCFLITACSWGCFRQWNIGVSMVFLVVYRKSIKQLLCLLSSL